MKAHCLFFLVWSFLFPLLIGAFPLPSELSIQSEEDIIRYCEEGYFEGISPEELLQLYREKVNLNTATLSQLLNVPYMTRETAARIIAYRKSRVYFYVEQLLSDEVVELRDYNLMRPFLKAGWIRRVKGNVRLQANKDKIVSTLTAGLGGVEGEVRGELRERAHFIAGQEYCLSGKKESFLPEDWSLFWENDEAGAYAGSFRVHFGQGLLVCGGSLRSSEGIRGGTTAKEYFKGGALDWRNRPLGGSFFYSRFKRGEKLTLYDENKGEYQKYYCDNVIPCESAGGRITWESASLAVAVAGLHHKEDDKTHRLGSVAWRYQKGAVGFEGEAVSDGIAGAWQTAARYDGTSVRGEVLFYENTGMRLPLTDSIRKKTEAYWEGSVKKTMKQGSVDVQVRSYQYLNEENDLRCRFSAEWFPLPEMKVQACRYHYQRNLYYSSVKMELRKRVWKPAVEYRLYYSRAQKIYVNIDYSNNPFRAGLSLRYGGAYSWDKVVILSGALRLGRHYYFSGRYRYDRTAEKDGSSWSIYFRSSL